MLVTPANSKLPAATICPFHLLGRQCTKQSGTKEKRAFQSLASRQLVSNGKAVGTWKQRFLAGLHREHVNQVNAATLTMQHFIVAARCDISNSRPWSFTSFRQTDGEQPTTF